MTHRPKRKVSEKGQIRIPPAFRRTDVDSYLVPEPGVVSPEDEIRLYPENGTPKLEVDGQVLRVHITPQGQITIPADYRNIAGVLPGTSVYVQQTEDGVISIEPVTD